MNRMLVWHLAWRYLRGKRSGNAVPILSRISMVAIAIASCAMLLLLSVFNGFSVLVEDLYKAFYPEIKITAAKGKFFAFDDAKMAKVAAIPGVQYTSTSIEDYVMIDANDEQRTVMLKGVDENFFTVNDVKPYIIDGAKEVHGFPSPNAIIGLQVLNEMGLDINNVFSLAKLYYPNSQSENLTLAPESAFQSLKVKPDGIFRIQDEFDSKYMLVSLPLVQELFQQQGKYSSIELSIDKGADANKVRRHLQETLGTDFKIETRFEQNRTMYMVMRTEKWAIYAILVLVLLIASFNMVGALSLLVLEKQKDMSILKAMGAQPSDVRNVFIAEGMLWSLVGVLAGLLLGVLICLGQQHFQWIRMQGSFIIDAYPVVLQWADFPLIIGTVLFVGLIAAWYPAQKAKRAQTQLRSS